MGPLEGVRIVEFAGIGPGPFAGMMLADMGAEILRIDRKAKDNPDAATRGNPQKDIPSRGRKSIALDLKKPGATETALRLIEKADGLFEGFRPGVMERLGLGPEDCHAINAKLVYGRMTGWGQEGPLAMAAGHDMNYISLSGALWAIGEKDRDPVPPLNLLGDFGAGGMMLAYGMVCALLKAQRTGVGDVVDAAICDGTAALMAPVYAQLAKDVWVNERQSNRLDGAAPYYRVYKCRDGKWVSVAPLEPQFFDVLLQVLELPAEQFTDRLNPASWADQHKIFEEIFLTKTRDEWTVLMEGTDICFAPILDLVEAPGHPHNAARGVFVDAHGVSQPAPAPRFANSPVEMPGPPPAPGEHRDTALQGWGFAEDEIAELIETGVM
ncbi:MAG: CoA transferase [Alphaproteobacteria bacterium]|jgi:alpha-methylacyl-CoA racemase|nr:CoA transferase [Alphaproteobacteria bacterium]MBT4086211.1 CoA transferase [Alphaproteobacteria bacterium]MBT4543828.1 CoA transferase [Alphaproteobacteria bacterium]MBT7744808.1 CoA transferase [Alphaproteobacteria bacterium]